MTRTHQWMLGAGIAALAATGAMTAGVRAAPTNPPTAQTTAPQKGAAAEWCPFHKLMAAWCPAHKAATPNAPAAAPNPSTAPGPSAAPEKEPAPSR